jgi:hypothetical protein
VGDRRRGCDDDRVKHWLRLLVSVIAVAVVAMPAHAAAKGTAPRTVPPPTVPNGPVATNDLVPNDVNNCVGTVERANCGSKARADGHTYLVFGILAIGLGFIAWRVGRGVRARDAARQATG